MLFWGSQIMLQITRVHIIIHITGAMNSQHQRAEIQTVHFKAINIFSWKKNPYKYDE